MKHAIIASGKIGTSLARSFAGELAREWAAA
jgi:hypothetical protein